MLSARPSRFGQAEIRIIVERELVAVALENALTANKANWLPIRLTQGCIRIRNVPINTSLTHDDYPARPD